MKEWKRKLLEQERKKIVVEEIKETIPVIVIQYSNHRYSKDIVTYAKKHISNLKG